MDFETFKQKVVDRWIKRDFERILEGVPVIPGGDGNINFLLALGVLSYMEALGSLLLGKDCDFKQNVKEYIEKCFSKPDEYPIGILKDIYRHGLAHEYFARGGVSRKGKHPAVFRDPNIGPVLDAETLANDFLLSLEKFKTELKKENYENRMKKLVDKIEKVQKDNEENINRLPSEKTTSISTSTCDVSSKNSSESNLNQYITQPPL